MPLTVSDRAQAVATFRFIEVRLMEIVAGWTPLTPEMEVKVMFGRHIWDFAQHADWLGKRTFELRQPENFTVSPAESYVRVVDEVSATEGTPERLSALYDVFLPALDGRYRRYISETDSLLDAPTVVIMERILAEMNRMREDAARLRHEQSIGAVSLEALARRERSHTNIVNASGTV